MFIPAFQLHSAIKAIVLPASLLSVALLPSRPASADLPRAEEEKGIVQDERDQPSCGLAGQIFIIGNTLTPQSIILSQLSLLQGEKFTRADLRTAERNLARLHLFMADPAPRVTMVVREDDDLDKYKDIRVEVNERPFNIYFYPIVETLEFAGVWAARGLFAAIQKSHGFPNELIEFALMGDRNACPLVISQFFRK